MCNAFITLTKNHRFDHTEFEKGLIQGILAATFTDTDETTLLRRYLLAVKNLLRNKNLIITPFNKRSGIVIRDTNLYIEKLESHLNDNTYITNEQTVNINTQKFNKTIKKLLTNEKKSWTKLIEYHPTTYPLYSLVFFYTKYFLLKALPSS